MEEKRDQKEKKGALIKDEQKSQLKTDKYLFDVTVRSSLMT